MSIPLSQLRWPSLAQDLAVMTVPGSPITELDVIYKAYNLTEQDLKDIIKVPKFVELYSNCLAEFRAQGTRAANVYRASSLSQALSEKLFRDAMDSQLDAKDAIKLLELLLKASGQLDKPDTQVNTQVNVGVQLPLPHGLSNPKLRHLEQ